MSIRRRVWQKQSRVEFKIGDRMWLYVPALQPEKTKKMSSLWHGPYTVSDKTGAVNFIIQLIGSTTTSIWIVHLNRLKPCFGEPGQHRSKWSVRPRGMQPHSLRLCQDPISPVSGGRLYRDVLVGGTSTARYMSSDSIGQSQPQSQSTSSTCPACERHSLSRYMVTMFSTDVVRTHLTIHCYLVM